MLSCESRQGRRIVGRLDRGVELPEALTEICRKHQVRCGTLQAIGALEAIEVAGYDQRTKQYRPARRFQGGCEILNLVGNISERSGEISIQAKVTAMRDGDNGIEILGGHLVRARVFTCEFVIETFDDLILRRTADEATGLALWSEKYEASSDRVVPSPSAATEPVSVEPPAADSPSFVLRAPSASAMPSATWADVARSSRLADASEEAIEESFDLEQLRTGDLLEHPRFGRCTVERIEGHHEFAAVRLETGRLVRLALDVLRFKLAREDAGRRVISVRVQK